MISVFDLKILAKKIPQLLELLEQYSKPGQVETYGIFFSQRLFAFRTYAVFAVKVPIIAMRDLKTRTGGISIRMKQGYRNILLDYPPFSDEYTEQLSSHYIWVACRSIRDEHVIFRNTFSGLTETALEDVSQKELGTELSYLEITTLGMSLKGIKIPGALALALCVNSNKTIKSLPKQYRKAYRQLLHTGSVQDSFNCIR